MKYGHRVSVRAATAVLVCCVIAATTVIVVATRSSAARHEAAQQEATRAIDNGALYEDALGGVYDEWVTVIAFFVLQDQSYLDRFENSRKTAGDALIALRDDALAHDPDDAVRINAMITTHAGFADSNEKVIAAIRSGDLANAINIAVGSGSTADSEALLGELGSRLASQRVTLSQAQDDQQAAELATLRWSLVIGAMCAGLLLAVAFAAFEWIGRPLRRASAATRAIAAGDLTAKVRREGPAELANLAADVNSMAEALILRSEELNAYLSKNLETRTTELEQSNRELALQVEERTRAEEALARTLEVERELEEQLRHQAFHDPLTNLANRARFMDRLEHGLQRASRFAAGIGGPLHRPRRLQVRQRQPRPPGRRPAPHRDRRPPAGVPAPRRHRRPPRRRRVRDPARRAGRWAARDRPSPIA